MYKNYPYLNDKTFLHEICSSKNTSQFVKVTCLTWKQDPIRQIQGEVTTGSFSIDGTSSVRRTGNLNFSIGNFNPLIDINSIFAINKKIYLQIGLQNNTKKYTDQQIIWFPMGIYVIAGASCTRGINNITINLQLKDKMCLLNGECGGVIPAAVTFSSVETIDKDGNIITSQPTIFQIIQELVHHFGKQDLNKILISDLDIQIKQVMKWTGSNPLYISRNRAEEEEFRITMNYNQYNQSLQQGFSAVEGTPFEYGKDVGYIYTDFTYPGQLVCDAGSTITSILDKIVSVLTNYEYFYDVYGNFIFREIKNYLNNSQTKDLISKIKSSGSLELSDYIIDLNHGKASYIFENSDLIISYGNTPQYNMIKNDFVVWGVRKNNGNNPSLVRYHLAIDQKPTIGHTYKAFQYEDPYDGIKKWHCPIQYETKENFPTTGAGQVYYYDKQTDTIYTWQNKEYIEINASLKEVTTTDWRTQLYFQGVVAEPLGLERNEYYSELKNEWPKIYDIKPDERINTQIRATAVSSKNNLYYNTPGTYYYCISDDCLYKVINYGIFNDINYQKINSSFFTKPSNIRQNNSYNFTLIKANKSGFKQEIFTNPMNLDYFLDFIDTNSEIQYISKKEIGKRSYSIQSEQLNCVFEPVMPDVVLINIADPNLETIRNECIKKNQIFYQVPSNIYDTLTVGGTFNSCYEYIRQLIHQYTNYNENVSISCIPLYFLQPNTRIYLRDDESGIEGDFMINNINFGLNSNTMTITATKALSKV